jgi:hypothetical protein
MSGFCIAFVSLNAVSESHTQTSIKTRNFVTFYKFLMQLGVHHTSIVYGLKCFGVAPSTKTMWNVVTVVHRWIST